MDPEWFLMSQGVQNIFFNILVKTVASGQWWTANLSDRGTWHGCKNYRKPIFSMFLIKSYVNSQIRWVIKSCYWNFWVVKLRTRGPGLSNGFLWVKVKSSMYPILTYSLTERFAQTVVKWNYWVIQLCLRTLTPKSFVRSKVFVRYSCPVLC